MKLSTRLLLTAALAATVSHSAFAAEPLKFNKNLKLNQTTPKFSQAQSARGNGASQGSSSSNLSRFNPSLVNKNPSLVNKQLTPNFSKSGKTTLPGTIFNPSNGSAKTGALNGNLINKNLIGNKIGRSPIKNLTPILGNGAVQNGNGAQNGNGNTAVGNGILNPNIRDLIKTKPGVGVFNPIFDPGVVADPGNGGGGGAADPGQGNPPSADPNPGSDPPADPGQPGDPMNPPQDPPHDDHHCPPKNCHPHWPFPGCKPHQHCPPCVSTIWWPTYTPPVTVVVEQPVVVTPEPQRLQLIVGQPADLALPGLAAAPTAAALEVNGIGLPVQVVTFTPEMVQIAVPLMGLSQPMPAKLYIFNAEMQPLVEMDVLLVVAPQ
jgi:hypothetical protein